MQLNNNNNSQRGTGNKREQEASAKGLEESIKGFSKQIVDMHQFLEDYDAYVKYSNPVYKKRQIDLRKQNLKSSRNISILKRMVKYAAILMLPIITAGIGIYLFYNSESRRPIPPGKEMAIFTLSNGDVMEMDAKTTRVFKKNGSEVILPKISVNDYIAQINDFDLANYSTVVIPQGGFFNVTLSDGSKIWLNSKSKLRFPFKFSDKERRVWLEGEACFNVSKDSIPFIVSTDNQNITVLGTIFNITAYSEDNFVTTALLSGSVKVENFLKDSTIYLEPGECATYHKENWKFEKYSDDVQLYTLWKEGVFKFQDERLEDIVKILKRWYHFDVYYENEEIKNMRFNVIALKNNPLDNVFKLLQSTTSFRYSRDGNQFHLFK